MIRTVKSLVAVACAVFWFSAAASAADKPGLKYPTHQISIPANGTTAGVCEDGATSAAVSTTTAGEVGISISGTWTGTLVFYVNLGNLGYTSVGSTVSNGSWVFPVGGAQSFCVAFNTSAQTGAALVVLNSTPAATQAAGVVLASGSISTISVPTILAISGTQWATARFAFTGTLSSQTLEFDYSSDGINWTASGQGAPYVRRIDATTANPTTVFGSTATVGGNNLSFNINTYGASTWDLPLAGNVVAVRLLPLSAGAGAVTVTGGLPYVPGVPVVATLFDVTSIANTALDTLVLDLSGWSTLTATYVTPAGGSGKVYLVGDDGNSIFGGSLGAGGTASFLAAASAFCTATFSSTQAVTITSGSSITGQGTVALGPPGKRMDFFAAAVAGLTSRIRVEAKR